MVYLLLAIGVIVGVYALYRFFLTANATQITAAFKTAIFICFVGGLLFLAVTGRLPAALALFGAISPFLITFIRKKFFKAKQNPEDPEIIDVEAEEVDDKDNKGT